LSDVVVDDDDFDTMLRVGDDTNAYPDTDDADDARRADAMMDVDFMI
jgi:hypothetical protein